MNVTTPVLTPVATPVVAPIVAIVVLLLLHVPTGDAVGFVYVSGTAVQIVEGPRMVPGFGQHIITHPQPAALPPRVCNTLVAIVPSTYDEPPPPPLQHPPPPP